MKVKYENGKIYTLNGGAEWTRDRFLYLKSKYPSSQVLILDDNGEKYLAQFQTLELYES